VLTFALEGGIGPKAAKAMADATKRAVLAVALDVREGVIGNLRGDPLNTKSGTLIGSWSRFPETGEDSGGAFAKLASSVVYSAIHEFGGTVVPVRARRLTIPLDAVKNASGTRTKFSARELFDSPGLLGFDRVFVRKGGRAVLGARPGKAGEVVPLFALVDSVKIPPRKYVSDAIKATRGRVARIVKDAVEFAFGRAGS